MRKNKLENIKDLCEYIWYLEDKYDLFNLEINGVHPWAAYRMDLYHEIGITLSDGIYPFTHWIAMGIGYVIYKLGASRDQC